MKVGRLVVNLFLIAIILVIAIGLYFSKMGQIVPGAWLAAKKDAGIFVTGTGMEMMTPDIAKVNLGVSIIETDVSESFKTANKSVDKIKAAVAKLGVEDKDVQTSRYSIYPEYSYATDQQVLKGYRTEHILTITVRDTAKLNDIVSDSVDAGANRIEDISFTTEDNSKTAAKARGKALKDADQKAQDLAKSFGAGLGQVISVQETVAGEPVPFQKAIEGFGGASSPSVSPGQLAVTVNVSVNYALKY